jgi:hypothetical protein
MCRLEDNIKVNTKVFMIPNRISLKNGVFWDVTPFGSCKNRRFGRT